MLGSYFVFCWQINDLQLMLGCSKVLVLRIQDLAYYLYIYIYLHLYLYVETIRKQIFIKKLWYRQLSRFFVHPILDTSWVPISL